MSTDEKALNTFTTRVRQMILQYKELQKENEELYTLLDERDSKIQNLEEKIRQAQNDYDSLKMAKMISITDGDMEGAQKRVAKLIRDVNKCITLLSDK